MGRTSKEKQAAFITAFRNSNYVLAEALRIGRVSERTFRRWYVEDARFRDTFTDLEDEQMIFLRQTMREMAAGTHGTSDGKPDRTLLRYLLTDFYRRRDAKRALVDAGDMEMLGDLEELSDEEIKKLADDEDGDAAPHCSETTGGLGEVSGGPSSLHFRGGEDEG